MEMHERWNGKEEHDKEGNEHDLFVLQFCLDFLMTDDGTEEDDDEFMELCLVGWNKEEEEEEEKDKSTIVLTFHV